MQKGLKEEHYSDLNKIVITFAASISEPFKFTHSLKHWLDQFKLYLGDDNETVRSWLGTNTHTRKLLLQ